MLKWKIQKTVLLLEIKSRRISITDNKPVIVYVCKLPIYAPFGTPLWHTDLIVFFSTFAGGPLVSLRSG